VSSDKEANPSRPADTAAWLQALFAESPLAIGFSRDGVTLDVNAAYVRLFGYSSVEEMRGRSILDQIAPSARPQIMELVGLRARGQPVPEKYETRGLRKDGTEFPFEITTTRVVVEDGPLTLAFITDLSERASVLAALRSSEEMFRTLASAAVEGVFVHAEGRILLANEAGAAMYGLDAASSVGYSLMELTAPESRSVVAEHVRRGSTEPYEGVAMRADGTTFMAEVRGRTLSRPGPPLRVAIVRDITDRKAREAEQRALAERVRHAQKLESLGVLAGGIAHDFNNILTVITNGVALARRTEAVGASVGSHLDTIALAAQRAADLCRQMLAYTGKVAFVREAVDMSALVAEMSSMLEVSVGTKATIARELAPNLPRVLGDATQVRQVVMNLVLNASEAIASTQGAIRVSTGAGTYGAETFAGSVAGGEPKAGEYVYVEVTDDGVGMDAETIANMFDPFFTTKFVGRGLGMAAVLGIVRGHEGAIEVDSIPGAGTRIRVYFPAAATKEASARPSREQVEFRGHGVVLIADDEVNVRQSTTLLLEGAGFEVIGARDGVEAVEVFRAHAARISAVLLDLTMPRKDGFETLKDLRSIAPEVPVVLVSGYGANAGRRSGESNAGVAPDAVLAKPYSVDQLLATLQGVMRDG
jgi:PAS domain S-box-containing protein